MAANVDDICTDDDKVEFKFAPKQLPQDVISHDKSSLMITILKAEFDHLKQELKAKDRRLLALHNVHFLLQEKDRGIVSLKEKNQMQADALILSEMRYSQLVRLTSKSAKQTEKQNLESKCCVAKTSSDGNETSRLNTNVKLSKHSEGISHFSKTYDQDLSNQSENSVEDYSSQVKQETLEAKCSGKTGLETDEMSFKYNHHHHHHHNHSVASIKASEVMLEMTKSKIERKTFERESVGKDRSVVEPLAINSHQLPVRVSFKVPEVSKDLVSKLMHQNARLKQVLHQVTSRQGVTMEDFLDRQEYISVVEQLRKEIRLLQLRGNDKDELLMSIENSDVTGLAATNRKLQETIHRQNRILAVKEAMVDVYSNRCEELELELKRIKICIKLNDTQTAQTILVLKKADVDSFTQWSSPVSELAIDRHLDCKRPLANEMRSLDSTIQCTKSVTENQISVLICKRCERDFNLTEKEKFFEHCRRCSDV